MHWTGSTYDEYTTTYDYDNYGNITCEIDPRGTINPSTGCTTKTTYDSDGMFPIITENALGQTITRTFEPDFGTVLTETDNANGLTTEYEYDEFGRVDYVTYPDGLYEDYYYHVVQGNHYITITASMKTYLNLSK